MQPIAPKVVDAFSNNGMRVLEACYNFKGPNQGTLENKTTNLSFILKNGPQEVRFWNSRGQKNGILALCAYPNDKLPENESLNIMSHVFEGAHPITKKPFKKAVYHISLGQVPQNAVNEFGEKSAADNTRYASLKVEEVMDSDGKSVKEYKITEIDGKILVTPFSIIPKIQIVLGQTFPHFGILVADHREEVEKALNGVDGKAPLLGFKLTKAINPLHISLLHKEDIDDFKMQSVNLTLSAMAKRLEPLKQAVVLALPGKIMQMGKKNLGMIICSEETALNTFDDVNNQKAPEKRKTLKQNLDALNGGDTPKNRRQLVYMMAESVHFACIDKSDEVKEERAVAAKAKADKEASLARMNVQEKEVAEWDRRLNATLKKEAAVLQQAAQASTAAVKTAKAPFLPESGNPKDATPENAVILNVIGSTASASNQLAEIFKNNIAIAKKEFESEMETIKQTYRERDTKDPIIFDAMLMAMQEAGEIYQKKIESLSRQHESLIKQFTDPKIINPFIEAYKQLSAWLEDLQKIAKQKFDSEKEAIEANFPIEEGQTRSEADEKAFQEAIKKAEKAHKKQISKINDEYNSAVKQFTAKALKATVFNEAALEEEQIVRDVLAALEDTIKTFNEAKIENESEESKNGSKKPEQTVKVSTKKKLIALAKASEETEEQVEARLELDRRMAEQVDNYFRIAAEQLVKPLADERYREDMARIKQSMLAARQMDVIFRQVASKVALDHARQRNA